MTGSALAPRLRLLPLVRVLGLEVPLANRFDARLLGLAWLDRAEVGVGLLLPRCASVHTYGMRFALDLAFLDEKGLPLAVHRRVPRRRLLAHRGAAAVLESPSVGGEFLSSWT